MKASPKNFRNQWFRRISVIFILSLVIFTACNVKLGNKHLAVNLKCDSTATPQATLKTSEIIKNRLLGYGIADKDIVLTINGRDIKVDLSNIDNPTRIIALITKPGKLEFFETIEFKDLYTYLDQADKRMAEIMISEDSLAAIKDPASVAPKKTEKKKPVNITDTASLISRVKNGAGSLNAEAQGKSLDEYAREHPLLAVLQPNFQQEADGKYNYGRGPMVGYCSINDTAKVNTILKRKEIQFIFPPFCRFLWERVPYDLNKTTLRLIAIKTGRSGAAPIDGSYITDAKQENSQGGQNEISMTMNTDGTRIWKLMTRDNIGKSIAIVLDNYVYTYPVVQSEIPSGRSQITGNFTVEEAKDLATIFKMHELPVKLTATDSTITEQGK